MATKKTTAKTLPVKGMALIRDVKSSGREYLKRVRYVRYAGRTFRITFENSNGTPCGYDHKHCVAILDTATGQWNNTIDKDYIKDVAGPNAVINTAEYFSADPMWASRFIEAAQKAIEELYHSPLLKEAAA